MPWPPLALSPSTLVWPAGEAGWLTGVDFDQLVFYLEAHLSVVAQDDRLGAEYAVLPDRGAVVWGAVVDHFEEGDAESESLTLSIFSRRDERHIPSLDHHRDRFPLDYGGPLELRHLEVLDQPGRYQAVFPLLLAVVIRIHIRPLFTLAALKQSLSRLDPTCGFACGWLFPLLLGASVFGSFAGFSAPESWVGAWVCGGDAGCCSI